MEIELNTCVVLEHFETHGVAAPDDRFLLRIRRALLSRMVIQLVVIDKAIAAYTRRAGKFALDGAAGWEGAAGGFGGATGRWGVCPRAAGPARMARSGISKAYSGILREPSRQVLSMESTSETAIV